MAAPSPERMITGQIHLEREASVPCEGSSGSSSGVDPEGDGVMLTPVVFPSTSVTAGVALDVTADVPSDGVGLSDAGRFGGVTEDSGVGFGVELSDGFVVAAEGVDVGFGDGVVGFADWVAGAGDCVVGVGVASGCSVCAGGGVCSGSAGR